MAAVVLGSVAAWSAPAAAAGEAKTPWYRLANPRNGDHFYTQSAAERSYALNTGYRNEGMSGYVATAPGAGVTAFYRLNSAVTGDHFYTTSVPERDNALKYGYKYEGVGGYLASTPASGTTPLYRLVNPRNGDHFYTQSAAERNSAPAYGYRYEGVAGYIFTTGTSTTPTQPSTKGIVSFTFDDAWKNIYSQGRPLFNKNGVKTTQYLLTDTTEYPDYMTVLEMQGLGAEGHEIGSHTKSHADLTTLNAAALTEELAGSKSALLGWFPGKSSMGFATPYGAFNDAVIAEIKKHYTYHRSTEEGFNSKTGFDRYNIKVQNVYSTTSGTQVNNWINQAINNNTWLVLVYHQVTAAAPELGPGETEADNIYWTSPTVLDAELSYAVSKKNAGILDIMTVEQALAASGK